MRYRDISIRKKILLSNFLMILIPVICVCLILAALLLGFSFLTDSSSSLIRNVLLNSSNYGPTLLIKTMSDEISASDQMNDNLKSIFHELEKANLHIVIREGDDILYVSDGWNEQRIQDEFVQIAQTASYKVPYIIWNQNGMAYAAILENNVQKQWNITFSGSSLKLPANSYESWEQTKLKIKIGIVLTGVVAITSILFLGLVLTRKLSRYILQPLSLLQRATTDIKNGDLSCTIEAQTQDEFGILCDNFESMRKQLVASDQKQKQYETQRKELIAGISHDLSTPLTSIQGYVDGLMDGIADTPEKQQHYLQIIQDKALLMNNLVDSLFLLSKLDMQEEVLHMEHLDLNAYMQSWYNEERTQHDDVTLMYKGSSFSCPVMLDTVLFIRVLNNLSENSIKYKKGNHVCITITLKSEADTCLLTFHDDGQGADKDDVKHLFERFYRGDPSRSSKIRGNGLGLAITRHIIEQMHGTIWAESEINHGLCIFIRLPYDKENTQ